MNYMKIALILTAGVVLSGCNVTIPEEIIPEAFTKNTQNSETPEPVAADSSKRFTSSAAEGTNFEDVRVWAEKYKQLSEQNEQLKKRNDELVTDNKRIMERFEVMQSILKTTEKELSDANEMLIEMRKELDSWKTDVLGFREETNYVHKEQLKALVKILKLLGAEYTDSEQE